MRAGFEVKKFFLHSIENHVALAPSPALRGIIS